MMVMMIMIMICLHLCLANFSKEKAQRKIFLRTIKHHKMKVDDGMEA